MKVTQRFKTERQTWNAMIGFARSNETKGLARVFGLAEEFVADYSSGLEVLRNLLDKGHRLTLGHLVNRPEDAEQGIKTYHLRVNGKDYPRPDAEVRFFFKENEWKVSKFFLDDLNFFYRHRSA